MVLLGLLLDLMLSIETLALILQVVPKTPQNYYLVFATKLQLCKFLLHGRKSQHVEFLLAENAFDIKSYHF